MICVLLNFWPHWTENFKMPCGKQNWNFTTWHLWSCHSYKIENQQNWNFNTWHLWSCCSCEPTHSNENCLFHPSSTASKIPQKRKNDPSLLWIQEFNKTQMLYWQCPWTGLENWMEKLDGKIGWKNCAIAQFCRKLEWPFLNTHWKEHTVASLSTINTGTLHA